jgi:hypothetical protein
MQKGTLTHLPPRSTVEATAVYHRCGAVSHSYRAKEGGSGRSAACRFSCVVYRGRGATNRSQQRVGALGAADWRCERADGNGMRVRGDRLQVIL